MNAKNVVGDKRGDSRKTVTSLLLIRMHTVQTIKSFTKMITLISSFNKPKNNKNLRYNHTYNGENRHDIAVHVSI